jgi:hypothetical protein
MEHVRETTYWQEPTMFNTVHMARNDIKELTQRISANEEIHGPGCRPELRWELAVAQEIVAQSEATRITWTKNIHENASCEEYIGSYTASGRTSCGEEWSATISQPPTRWPVASYESWGVQILINERVIGLGTVRNVPFEIRKGLGTVAAMKAAVRNTINKY